MNITFRALNKNDIKNHFECNDIELDLFLKKYASQNQFKHYIGTTYVATIKRKEIIGTRRALSSLAADFLDTFYKKSIYQNIENIIFK